MKENGFAIGLLAATVLVGGGLVAVGVMQGSKYNEALASYDEAKNDVERMVRISPFPSEANVEDRKQEVTKFLGKVEGLQKALENYRPETLEEVSPAEFQNRLVAANNEIKALFDEKQVAYPEQFAFGMEQYTDGLANPDSTGELDYQLKAFKWLFTELANVETYKLNNVRREGLPSEQGLDWLENLERGEYPEEQIAQAMPFEITFLCSEEAAREFINTVSTTGEYFFTIDAVRIEAESPNPPTREMSGLEEEGGAAESAAPADAFAAFGDFGDDEEEEVEEETADVVDAGRVLGQIAGPGTVGLDGVYVGLQMRLMYFTDFVNLPEFN
ncbi:MAG: Amuc_1100 family pilus-like protein [Verrucomicrobiota bacterium JB023]|nr:Amuc_1100 family pilus-like protein [Verrucomicrobiota bacterium JB023]